MGINNRLQIDFTCFFYVSLKTKKFENDQISPIIQIVKKEGLKIAF